MSTAVKVEDPDESDLQFQEFPLNDSPNKHTKVVIEDEFPEEHEELLKEEGKQKASVFEFSFYQSFWDVSTSQVLSRIIWSMVPSTGRNTFLNQHIKNNPDLYGPFWICITLVFSIAISSNIADYLSSAGKTNNIWHYDFHKVTMAAATIFSYIFLLPIILWMLLKYNTLRGVRFTLLEILCAYGYSIFIYIPISILWVIQVPALQWTLVIIGALLSGSNLVRNFWPALRHTNVKENSPRMIGALVLSLILLFHSLLAASFVLYFFKPSETLEPTLAPLTPIMPNGIEVTKLNLPLEPTNFVAKPVEKLPDMEISEDKISHSSPAKVAVKDDVIHESALKDSEQPLLSNKKTISNESIVIPADNPKPI